MSFLTPWTALAAAAAAIPLLLLLYFLKLRRQPLRVPSTLLWRRSVEDLEVNAPFQRLRWSLLLLLQLLLLLALLAALGEPILEVQSLPRSGRMILIVDHSASMNALDAPPEQAGGPPTARLAAAKAAAAEVIGRLMRGSRSPQVMLIAAGASAEVACGFESRRQTLLDAIASIEPTDETLDLAAAFQLAGAFATHDESAQLPPDVVLISDGGVGPSPDAAGFTLPVVEFRLVRAGAAEGQAVNNVGLVAFSARRAYDDPAHVQVFARLINAGASPISTTLTLRADDQVVATKRVELPAAEEKSQGHASGPGVPGVPGAPGEVSVTFDLPLAGGAVLTVRHGWRDALAEDDMAALVVPPPPAPRLAIVHPDDAEPDPFLSDLLAAMKPASIRVMSRSAYGSLDPQQLDSGVMFDLVVLDRVSGLPLPGVNSLSVGGAPQSVAVVKPLQPGGRRVLSWDRQHPLMRHVSLDGLVFADFGALGLDAAATAVPLAFGPDGPVIAALTRRDRRHVVVGFELIRSNWPAQVSLAVFMQNVMDWLTASGMASSAGAAQTEAGLWFAPGQAIAARTAAGVQQVTIDGPMQATIAAAGASPLTLPMLRRVGLYHVRGVIPPMDVVAVNLLSETESDTRPRDALVVNAKPVAAGGVGEAAPLALWPWLVAAALTLLVIEWLVYCIRRRG